MRTIARAKAGFYPTPDPVTRAISKLIQNPSRHPGRLCDPCCGLGQPASTLAQSLGLLSFGIELERSRFQASKLLLTDTLRSDAFATTIQKQSMSLVFLNPPYDDAGKRQRSEPAWLRLLSPALQSGGVLVFILPEPRVTKEIRRYLATHFRQVAFFRFPHPEYLSFRQVVIFGMKTASPLQDRRRIDALAAEVIDYQSLEGDLTPLYAIPPQVVAGPIEFRSHWVSPEDQLAEASAYGIWQDPRIHDGLHFPVTGPCIPLMPLRKGHLARMIAAGMLNNQTIATGPTCWIIKGFTDKTTRQLPPEQEEYETQKGRETRTVTRVIEMFVPQIQAWDITEGSTYGQHIIVNCSDHRGEAPETP
ncbi:MAG: DUF6094 domain-containing protein [Nitrospiraceae bacterium]